MFNQDKHYVSVLNAYAGRVQMYGEENINERFLYEYKDAKAILKKAEAVPATETAAAATAAAAAAGAAAAEGTDSENREIPEEEEAEEEAEEEDDSPIVLDITAPMTGKVLPLSSVKDASFASGEIGKGVCIIPDNGDVFAPADGVVTMVYGPANHAIALKLEDSVEAGGQR